MEAGLLLGKDWYLAQHYTDATGPELAQQLGRTLGSLKGFIRANPELQKRPKIHMFELHETQPKWLKKLSQ